MSNPTTVIIADNSEEFCAALSEALHRTDRFQVIGTASDGEQALGMITQEAPDLLVLDLMLAKRDGISILKSIAALEHRPATLATSGFVTDYVAAAAANLGAKYLSSNEL